MMVPYAFTKKIIDVVKSLFKPKIKIAIFDEDKAYYKPKYATDGSAAIDLITPIPINLRPGESVLVKTNLAMEIQKDWVGIIAPKSGLGVKYHVQLTNTLGVIDSDYRGEVEVKITIPYTEEETTTLMLTQGDKFVQMLFFYCPQAELDYVSYSELSETERGVGGFGSTGR